MSRFEVYNHTFGRSKAVWFALESGRYYGAVY